MPKKSEIPSWILSMTSHPSLAVRELAHEVAEAIKTIPAKRRSHVPIWRGRECTALYVIDGADTYPILGAYKRSSG